MPGSKQCVGLFHDRNRKFGSVRRRAGRAPALGSRQKDRMVTYQASRKCLIQKEQTRMVKVSFARIFRPLAHDRR